MWLYVKFYLNLCLWYMYTYQDERWDTNSFIIQFVCFDRSSHDDGWLLRIFMNEFLWFCQKEELQEIFVRWRFILGFVFDLLRIISLKYHLMTNVRRQFLKLPLPSYSYSCHLRGVINFHRRNNTSFFFSLFIYDVVIPFYDPMHIIKVFYLVYNKMSHKSVLDNLLHRNYQN